MKFPKRQVGRGRRHVTHPQMIQVSVAGACICDPGAGSPARKRHF
jgi:hypothetical protein